MQKSALQQLANLLTNKSTSSSLAEAENDKETLKLAIEHGVAGLLSESLQNNSSHNKTPLTNLAKDYDIHNSRRLTLLDFQYQLVLQALHKNNIRFIVLKGFALAYSIYSRPSLRTRSDVDILINPDQQGELKQVMSQMGFTNPRGWQPNAILSQFSMRKKITDGLNVDFDIHLKISNDVSLQSLIQLEEVLPLANTTSLNDVPLVNVNHGIIHAAIHLLHHRNVGDKVKLIWLYDLKLLCEALTDEQQQQLKQQVEQKGIGKLVHFALGVADEMFNSAALKEVMMVVATCKSDNKFDYLILIDNKTTQFKRALAKRKTLREKWRYCQEILFPPAAEITAKYGEKKTAWLPFYYLKRAWGGAIERIKNK